jgi:perosamine synthetase
MRLLKDQGMDRKRGYWHPVVGYNYRLTNVAAALGLAQLEKIDDEIEGRSQVASWYREYLQDFPGMVWQAEKEWAKRVWFLFTLVVDRNTSFNRDEFMSYLRKHGIDTRPLYHPLHTLPPYVHGSNGGHFPVSERISQRGTNLPTWAGLSRGDVRYVCKKIIEYLEDSKTSEENKGMNAERGL